MPRKKLHAKIKKNLYDLDYNRYSDKCHSFINLGVGFWLAFIAIIATYLIDRNLPLTKGIIMFVSIVTGSIFLGSLLLYWQSRNKRSNVEKKIKELNPEANSL